MRWGFRFAGIVAAALLSSGAEAQFSRGMMRESVEVTLFPIQTPEALLPAGTVRVELKNTSSAPARIVDQLQSGIGRQIAENDSRVRVAPQADFVVAATVTEWSTSRRTGTKYVSEQRQTGTKKVTDSKGNVRYDPVYEYGHNERTVIHEGSVSVRLQLRQESTEAQIEDLTARVSYYDETVGNQSPPTDAAVEDAIIDKAIHDAAAKLSPGRQRTRVLMARSDEVDRFNTLARDRKWADIRTALEQLPPHKDAKKDAYRLHNLGVAHEALAYETQDRATARAELKAADALMASAALAKKDEKYFVESAQRVSGSLRSLDWIGEREMQLAERFPLKPAPRATSRPTEAVPSAPAAPTTKRAPAKGATAKADAAMTNADVIDLAKAGLDDTILIATIREAASVNFDLGPTALRALLAAKVSNPVITVMRERAKP